MRWLPLLLFALNLIHATAPAYAATDTGLRVWIRDLDDRGIAGVQLTMIDANKQPREVQTDAEGMALVVPLRGTAVRIVRAASPDGQALLMDENDRDGGLRIPLQAGALQPLDLRITDGMLFVEPVAEAEDGPGVAMEPSAAGRLSTPVRNESGATTVTGAPGAPEAVARHGQWTWLRGLVLAVLVAIVAVAAGWQVLPMMRARGSV